MNIQINNEIIVITGNETLTELLTKYCGDLKHIAVALNGHFIPRVHHTTTFFKDGDKIDLISPMQGG